MYFITKYFNSIYSNCVILCINCILFYWTCFVHCCAVMHSVGRLTEVRKSQLNSHVNQTIDTCLMVASSIDHQFQDIPVDMNKNKFQCSRQYWVAGFPPGCTSLSFSWPGLALGLPGQGRPYKGYGIYARNTQSCN